MVTHVLRWPPVSTTAKHVTRCCGLHAVHVYQPDNVSMPHHRPPGTRGHRRRCRRTAASACVRLPRRAPGAAFTVARRRAPAPPPQVHPGWDNACQARGGGEGCKKTLTMPNGGMLVNCVSELADPGVGGVSDSESCRPGAVALPDTNWCSHWQYCAKHGLKMCHMLPHPLETVHMFLVS